MADIKDLKKQEMSEIADFFDFIGDYGHIFHESPQVLDGPFSKIIEGINEVKKIVNRNYSA